MAEQETTTAEETTPEETSTEETTGEDWKGHARRHEREAKKARKEADELRTRLAEHDDASKTETERAIEQARKEAADAARAEVSESYRAQILSAEIRAQAAGKFANPRLAARLLDLDVDAAFSDDGEVNSQHIARQIDEFLEADENAGLRAGPTRTTGSADAGRGSAGATGGDMNDFIRTALQRT